MGNSLTKNPLLLDTASTSAVLSTNKYRVTSLTWIDPSTAGHTCVLKDKDGNIFESMVAVADNTEVSRFYGGRGRDLNGIIMHTLASGVLEIHYD